MSNWATAQTVAAVAQGDDESVTLTHTAVVMVTDDDGGLAARP